MTLDMEFYEWVKKILSYGSGLGLTAQPEDFRKEIIIEMYDEAGQLAIAYKVHRCRVSEFQSQRDLDANSNAMAIELIKLENEGWECDTSFTAPQ